MIKNIVKSIISILVVFFVFSGTLFAEKTGEMDFNRSIKLALENNLDLKIANLDLENAQIDYEKTKANNLLTESRYIQLQGDLGLLQAKENYNQTRNEVIIDVVQKYLQLNQAKKNITAKSKEAELEKNLLEEVKAQVRAGHKGNLDLLQQENSYNNTAFDLEKANDDYQQTFREFQLELGLNNKEEEELNLTEVNYPEIWKIDEKQALKKVIENSFTLELRRRQIELAKVDLERAEVAASPELDLQKLRNNIELANLNFNKTQKELNNSIKTQYYLYKQAINNLDLSQQNLKQAQENSDIIAEQVKAGLKTKNSLLSAEISLAQAEYSLNSAILNYYTAKLTIQKLIGEMIEEGDIE
ncbi:MAG: TolC family protein [Candidatus Caldatribacteriota bacterium]|nr:TolC family protein [Candidatus Caldatribacteriota bacterium]